MAVAVAASGRPLEAVLGVASVVKTSVDGRRDHLRRGHIVVGVGAPARPPQSRPVADAVGDVNRRGVCREVVRRKGVVENHFLRAHLCEVVLDHVNVERREERVGGDGDRVVVLVVDVADRRVGVPAERAVGVNEQLEALAAVGGLELVPEAVPRREQLRGGGRG